MPAMTAVDPRYARLLAALGRGGDTMIAHINPREARLLQALGGSGSINPRTGLPEFDDSSGDQSVAQPPQSGGPDTSLPSFQASGPFNKNNPQPQNFATGEWTDTGGDAAKLVWQPFSSDPNSQYYRDTPTNAVQISQSALDFQSQMMAQNPDFGSYLGTLGGGDPNNPNPWIATANNPYYTVNDQGTADLTPAGQSALEAKSAWGAAHHHKEGFFGNLADSLISHPLEFIGAAIGFPALVGGGVAALGGVGSAIGGEVGSTAADLGSVGSTGSSLDAAMASDLPSAGGGGGTAAGAGPFGGATPDLASSGLTNTTAGSLGLTDSSGFIQPSGLVDTTTGAVQAGVDAFPSGNVLGGASTLNPIDFGGGATTTSLDTTTGSLPSFGGADTISPSVATDTSQVFGENFVQPPVLDTGTVTPAVSDTTGLSSLDVGGTPAGTFGSDTLTIGQGGDITGGVGDFGQGFVDSGSFTADAGGGGGFFDSAGNWISDALDKYGQSLLKNPIGTGLSVLGLGYSALSGNKGLSGTPGYKQLTNAADTLAANAKTYGNMVSTGTLPPGVTDAQKPLKDAADTFNQQGQALVDQAAKGRVNTAVSEALKPAQDAAKLLGDQGATLLQQYQAGTLPPALTAALKPVIDSATALQAQGQSLLDQYNKGTLNPAIKAQVDQLTSTANDLTSQGKTLQGYLTSGTLPPAMEAQFTQQERSAEAGLQSLYASHGMSGSSAMITDIAAAKTASLAARGAVQQSLLATGISETQSGAQLYSNISSLVSSSLSATLTAGMNATSTAGTLFSNVASTTASGLQSLLSSGLTAIANSGSMANQVASTIASNINALMQTGVSLETAAANVAGALASQTASIVTSLISASTQATTSSAQLYADILNETIQQDAQLGNAITALASAAVRPTVNVSGTTKSTS